MPDARFTMEVGRNEINVFKNRKAYAIFRWTPAAIYFKVNDRSEEAWDGAAQYAMRLMQTGDRKVGENELMQGYKECFGVEIDA